MPGLRDDRSTELETLFREYYELVYRTEYSIAGRGLKMCCRRHFCGVVLLAAAFVAAVIPALRATRVDPAMLLRGE